MKKIYNNMSRTGMPIMTNLIVKLTINRDIEKAAYSLVIVTTLALREPRRLIFSKSSFNDGKLQVLIPKYRYNFCKAKMTVDKKYSFIFLYQCANYHLINILSRAQISF